MGGGFMAEAFTKKEMEKEIKRYLDIQAERFTHELGFVIDEVKAVEERLNRKIESEIVGLRKELTGKIESTADGLRKELTGKIESTADGLRKELTGKIESTADGLRKELTGKIESTDKKLSNKIDSLRDELIAHRDNTEVHVQKAKTKKRA
jgi:uncharacterized protein YjbJ (UPF0337 family)